MDSVFLQNLLRKVFGRAELREKASRRWYDSSLPFSRPFITIAREPGSGGAPIGREVARRLGFEFYDQQIVDEIAKSTKQRRDILQKVDEKGRTAVQDFIQGMLNPNYVSDVAFVKQLTKVIVSLAYRGNAVILGRGACFLTPKDKGLHLRITAPLSVRLARAVKHEEVSEFQAKEIIRTVGKDRRDFVRQYFGEDIRKAEHYDLVLNTEFFGMEESVDIILKAFEKKFDQGF